MEVLFTEKFEKWVANITSKEQKGQRGEQFHEPTTAMPKIKTGGKQTFLVVKFWTVALPDRINPSNIHSFLQTILDLCSADSAVPSILLLRRRRSSQSSQVITKSCLQTQRNTRPKTFTIWYRREKCHSVLVTPLHKQHGNECERFHAQRQTERSGWYTKRVVLPSRVMLTNWRNR